MSVRPLFLALTLVAPLLPTGCFLFAPATPSGPTPEQIAAEQEAREQERLRLIEEERTDFVTRVDAAKLAFEAEPSLEQIDAYLKVLDSYRQLDTESREGIDLNPHFDAIMASTVTMLEPRVAEWAKKKSRTPELKTEIKSIYAVRIKVLEMRKAQPNEYVADGATMLAMGTDRDTWKIGDGPDTPDYALISVFGGDAERPVFLELCKSALDQAIADDKKDAARQHYIMGVCLRHGSVMGESNWEEELLGWATAKQASKQTKSFIEAYRPIWADIEAQIAEANARSQAEDAQHWEDFDKRQAEVDAQIAGAQGGGGDGGGSSSSSGGDASAGPVSVTVRSSCGSTVKIFFGDDPKFGSGRSSSLGSNSRTSMQMKVGDTIWLTDDSQNGISSVTVSSSTREIEFTCNGVSGR